MSDFEAESGFRRIRARMHNASVYAKRDDDNCTMHLTCQKNGKGLLSALRIGIALWYSGSCPQFPMYSGGEKTMKKEEYIQFVMDSYRPAESLLKMVPVDKLDWKPGPKFMTLGQVICHLSGGIGGELRMLITGSWPKPAEMEESMKQGKMPSCTVPEALANLEKDKETLREVLAGITEEDFANKIVSTPWGWQSKMEQMALNFREHFTNHKMQLFTYLKLLGFPVDTNTLYGG